MEDAQKHMHQEQDTQLEELTPQQQQSTSAAPVEDALYASQMGGDNQPLYYPPQGDGGSGYQPPPQQYSPNGGIQQQPQGTVPQQYQGIPPPLFQQPQGPPQKVPQQGPMSQMSNARQPTQEDLQREHTIRQLPNDPTRNRNVEPGVLLYSAKMNRDSLKCYYCLNLYWCSGNLLSRTILDVYSQGVLMNVPAGKFCCCSEDDGRFIFYDDEPFSNPPVKAGCCDPFPFFCPHFCGCCGEVVALRSGGCTAPRGVGHWYCSCMIYLVFCKFGCCSSDMFAGLADGEADRVVAVLQKAMQAAKKFERTIALPEVPKGQMM